MTGREQVHVKLPVELVEKLREQDGYMYEEIGKALKMYMGEPDADSEAAIQRRIDILVDEIHDIDDDIDELQDTRARKVESLETERERLEEHREERATANEMMDAILEEIEGTSMSVHARKSDLRELAEREYGHQTTENVDKVISDLRARAGETDRAVSNDQFSEGTVGSVRSEGGRFDGLRSVGGSDD